MKKILANSISCIIICLLISSCASNISVVKRHYRGGYYVDYTKKAPTATRVANETAKTNSPKRVSVTAIPYREKQTTITGVPNQDISTISTNTVAVPENVQHKNSNSYAKQVLKQPVVAEAPVVVQDKQASHETIQGDYHGDDGGGAALSLLWIVIVIILIIWLIGILAGNFGIGGLINLLLVIALILLILWLLRIA